MIVLAEDPLCKSQISIQTIVISDFGNILTTLGLDAILILLKMYVDLIIVSITLVSIGIFVPSMRYRILSILRYDLNWGSCAS